MKPATTIIAAAFAGGVVLIVFSAVRVAQRQHAGQRGTGADAAASVDEDVPCGPGFDRLGARCMPHGCPAPLVVVSGVCDEPERSVVEVPATSVLIGPSDWEAEGRVRPRTVKTAAFLIDRFEVSAGRFGNGGADPARAAANVSLTEARVFCTSRGGRLPTEDEWIVAAAGDRPRRYPWGDTGAVCRRAAWGLAHGPCGDGAKGPDTVGSHPDGATPLGIQDLAGNVSEWVEAVEVAGASVGVVRGGSFETDLATDLRTWGRREVPVGAKEPSIGFRCAYEAVKSAPDQ